MEPTSHLRCTACDAILGASPSRCPKCGGPVQTMMAIDLGGSITPRGDLEVVADNPTPDGAAVQYVSPAGMRSHSTIGPGRVEATVQGPIDLGRASDSRVADRIIDQLRAGGREVEVLQHLDHDGEDRKIRCDGVDLTIQVVATPPDPGFLAQASRGSASTSVSIPQAAAWIADSVAKKGVHYPAATKARMLLAVDTRAAGVLSSSAIVAEIQQTYGDLADKHGFADVWLSGPSDSRSTRLPGR